MKRNILMAMSLAMMGAVALGSATITVQAANGCGSLPSWATLKQELTNARNAANGGLNLDMWGTIVDRDGIVCAVAFTGGARGDQWPGSRVISAQKANTANSFSLKGLALSTANLYSAVQPGGSLFGLQESNPVSTLAAYGGDPANNGQVNDGMVGTRIGGVNVFGGGLALYNSSGQIVGGVGVSGDTSCADHHIAWRVRNLLALDHMAPAGTTPAVGGVSGDATRPDNIVYDITANPGGGTGNSAGGFGHPKCLNTGNQLALPVVRP